LPVSLAQEGDDANADCSSPPWRLWSVLTAVLIDPFIEPSVVLIVAAAWRVLPLEAAVLILFTSAEIFVARFSIVFWAVCPAEVFGLPSPFRVV
jgi:hypothetical protein